MIIWGVSIFSLGWALWLTYMLRYPARWSAIVDRYHKKLQAYGLSAHWMQSAEKGVALKLLVATTVLISLTCVAVLLKHPTALNDFIHEHFYPNP